MTAALGWWGIEVRGKHYQESRSLIHPSFTLDTNKIGYSSLPQESWLVDLDWSWVIQASTEFIRTKSFQNEIQCNTIGRESPIWGLKQLIILIYRLPIWKFQSSGSSLRAKVGKQTITHSSKPQPRPTNFDGREKANTEILTWVVCYIITSYLVILTGSSTEARTEISS